MRLEKRSTSGMRLLRSTSVMRASRTRHIAVRACSEDLSQLTVPLLKERCRAAGLKVSGRKAELVERLLGSNERVASEPVAKAITTASSSARKEVPPQSNGVLLVDGMNVGAVLDVPRRTLFAMLHLLCLSRALHTTIIFDGPSFDRVQYESEGIEKGSAEWRALAGRGAAAHADKLPAVEFVGHFAKDAADDVLHERACTECKSGRTVLLWTFDKGLQRRVAESTAGRVQFLGREPMALLGSARPEWVDVARHPLGGGGIEDLLTGKGVPDSRLKDAAQCMLGVLSPQWASLLEDEGACGWVANCIGYGFTQVGIERGKEGGRGGGQVHILQEEWGLLDVLRERWAVLARTAHGRAVLRAAHPALGPETCCAIAQQHAELVYELSHSAEGAALVRTLIRQVRHQPEAARGAVRAIVGERWAAMATHDHAHAVVCALGPVAPLEILGACAAPSAGPLGSEAGEGDDVESSTGLRAMLADRNGAKVAKSVLMVLDGEDAGAQRAMRAVAAWAIEWVGAHPEPPQKDAATGELGEGWEQADLVWHFVKRCKMRDVQERADERLELWAASISWTLDPRDRPRDRGRDRGSRRGGRARGGAGGARGRGGGRAGRGGRGGGQRRGRY